MWKTDLPLLPSSIRAVELDGKVRSLKKYVEQIYRKIALTMVRRALRELQRRAITICANSRTADVHEESVVVSRAFQPWL